MFPEVKAYSLREGPLWDMIGQLYYRMYDWSRRLISVLLVKYNFYVPELSFMVYGNLLGQPMDSFPRAQWSCIYSKRCLG